MGGDKKRKRENEEKWFYNFRQQNSSIKLKKIPEKDPTNG